MISFVARRLLHSVPVVFAVSFLVFVVTHASGDPLSVVKGTPGTSPQTVERIVERHRLDEPVLSQYGHWLKTLATDGLGTTLLSERPVAPDLKRAFGNTAQLVVPALALGSFVGIFVGVVAAARRHSLFDHCATGATFLLVSLPQFWIALVLQVLFTNVYLDTGVRVFYTSGLSSSGGNGVLLDRARHLALPVLVLSLTVTVVVARFVRSSVLEALRAEFVLVARAKGLSDRTLLYRHVLRPAVAPVVTLVAAGVPLLFGEAVIVETVFSIDGFGRYLLHALDGPDIYPVMASFMVIALLTIASSLAADVALASLDPTVRQS